MTNDKGRQHKKGTASGGAPRDRSKASESSPEAGAKGNQGGTGARAGNGQGRSSTSAPAAGEATKQTGGPAGGAGSKSAPSAADAAGSGKDAGSGSRTEPTPPDSVEPPPSGAPSAAEGAAGASTIERAANSERAASTPAAPRPSTGPSSTGRPPGRGLALLALLIAVVAVLLTLLLNYRLQAQREEAAADDRAERALSTAQQALSEAESTGSEIEGVQGDFSERLAAQGNQVQAIAQEIDSLREAASSAREALESEIQTLALAQRGLSSSLDVVRETLASGGDSNAWTLSEVGYLLEIASARLRFQEDVTGALQALVLAKQRLASVNELAFAPVLTMLDETIAALRGVEPLDRSELAERISSLASTAAELPLRNEARTEALKAQAAAERASMGTEVDTSQPSWWRQALSNAWEEIKRLVVVRRERRDAPPLMGPGEEYFLAENLRLKLEAARMSALLGDGAAYQDSLNLVQRWLGNYFDSGSERVIEVQNELKEMQQIELHPYLPDVQRVLTAFNDVMATRQPVRTLPSEQGPAGGVAAPSAEQQEPAATSDSTAEDTAAAESASADEEPSAAGASSGEPEQPTEEQP